jgi:formylglycine-generating enzyme required for sulfatase activity
VADSTNQASATPDASFTFGPGTNPGDRAEISLPGGVKMAMRWIPAGSFGMGEETSPVQVRLRRGFWMGETEVTQAQYQAVMGTNPANWKGDTLPVEQVSWNDAVEFSRKLSASSGLTVSLPTEAQWEYACRAGSTTRFHTGNSDSDLGRAGWYSDNGGSKTSPVGQKEANAWGLRDMHGNVWEWCADWYDGSLPGGSDPTGPSTGSSRVDRGGSWVFDAQSCRSAGRNANVPTYRSSTLGFRPVLTVQ